MRIDTGLPAEPTRPARRWRLAALFFTLMLGIYTASLIWGGVWFYRSIRPSLLETTGAGQVSEALPAMWAAPGNLFRALRSEPPEVLLLDIAFKHLMKIREQRAAALESGVLMVTSADMVPATIRRGDESIPVKIRLKGDAVDHLRSGKWSMRVHVRNGYQLFGMRRFSLQAPDTRGFQAEPLVLAHLRREGVLALRYRFVDLTVNGTSVGLMALEEHFSKELLESQQRREGVIIRFDEEAFWRSRLENGVFGPYGNPLVSTIRPFRGEPIARSEKLSSDLEVAIGSLRGYLDGSIPAEDVFDVELMARFMAVAEVWKAHHMLAWHNLRLYLNPVTARLEPIGFDASLQTPDLGAGLVARRGLLTRGLLEDPDVRAAFVRSLRRIAGEMADGTLPEWIGELERPLLTTLHREYPLRGALDLNPLVARARSLESLTLENFDLYEPQLTGADMVYSDPVRAYLHRGADGARVELINVLSVPVTVTALDFTGMTPDDAPTFEPREPDSLPLTLAPTPLQGAPTPASLWFRPPPNEAAFGILGTARVAGQDRSYPFEAAPYFGPRRKGPIPTASIEEVLRLHPFLSIDLKGEMLRGRAGIWEVTGSLVLPQGIGLALPAGTELRFGPGEALIASGSLDFAGTPDAPVVFAPRNGDDPWAGIAALRSELPHTWNHVIVRETAGVSRDGWGLTGGVTLHGSDVSISNTRFEGTTAEDALNLIRSSFTLNDVSFRETASDALDADFSNGSITGGLYSGIGGDGIDVSGAEITIDGVVLEDIHDKALSVGEASRVVARNLRIERVGMAIVSKDASHAIVESSRVANASVAGIMAYQKKAEYGPAEVVANNVSIRSSAREAVAQLGSRIRLNGSDVEPQELDVDRLYATLPHNP